MPFEPGNENWKKRKEDKGGRQVYVYEKDQLFRLRKIADRGIALIEAIQKGKVTGKEVEKYKLLQPTLLKIFDKLQPNKQEIDHKNLPKILPTPILAPIFAQNVHIHNGNQENKQLNEENQGSAGGDISQQDSLNNPVVDSPRTI